MLKDALMIFLNDFSKIDAERYDIIINLNRTKKLIINSRLLKVPVSRF